MNTNKNEEATSWIEILLTRGDTAELLQIHNINMFLELYLDLGAKKYYKQAVEWYKQVCENRFDCLPNSMTFLLMLKINLVYYDRAKNQELTDMLDKMYHMRIYLRDIINNQSLLTEEEIQCLSDQIWPSKELKFMIETDGYKCLTSSLDAVQEQDLQYISNITNVFEVLEDAKKNESINRLHLLQLSLENQSKQFALELAKKKRKELLRIAKSQDFGKAEKMFREIIGNIANILENHYLQQETGFYSKICKQLDSVLLATIAVKSFALFDSLYCEHGMVRYRLVCKHIGQRVRLEIYGRSLKRYANKGMLKKNELPQLLGSDRLLSAHARDNYKKVMHLISPALSDLNWEKDFVVDLGKYLADVVLQNCTYERIHHEDKQIFRLTNIDGVELIKYNEEIRDYLLKSSDDALTNAAFAPMITPPKPWVDFDEGGYYNLKYDVVRSSSKTPMKLLHPVRAACSNGSMNEIFKGLDVLGKTRWVINERVFETVQKSWNKGISIGDLPPASIKAPVSEFPPDSREHKALMKEYENEKRNNFSIRCDYMYKLFIASKFSGIPIYFPHNLDFRGRAYPIPMYFSHMGGDLSRSLLCFHEKKPLGKRGLYWLKVHLANTYGIDKAPFHERVEFVDSNIDNIYDSADNPLKGNKWWANAENTWQCLAACIEVANALRHNPPEEYPCGLPIQQDGSCNGLQHYAALGRDVEGAKEVNLIPQERPQDVYSAVAKSVIKILESIPNEGTDISIKDLVTRKVVKQTVMTNVYGVTLYGGTLQIEERLKEKKVEKSKTGEIANKLASLVFQSLDEMFVSARQIQKWLVICANEISCSAHQSLFQEKKIKLKTIGIQGLSQPEKKQTLADPEHEDFRKYFVPPQLRKVFPHTAVSWITPLNLPVSQPYYVEDRCLSLTSFKKLTGSNLNIDKVNRMKQKNAFPPNFIHSLDAAHMFKTAIRCYEEGITFAAVHDSFWCHASDVDKMKDILREEFISLHSQRLIDDLRTQFMEAYKDHLVPITYQNKPVLRPFHLPETPALGDFDIQRIADSDYFFS